MICPEAAQLRRDWYEQCVQLNHPPYLDERSRMVINDQQSEYKYQRAVWRLRNHNQECAICKNGHEIDSSAN